MAAAAAPGPSSKEQTPRAHKSGLSGARKKTGAEFDLGVSLLQGGANCNKIRGELWLVLCNLGNTPSASAPHAGKVSTSITLHSRPPSAVIYRFSCLRCVRPLSQLLRFRYSSCSLTVNFHRDDRNRRHPSPPLGTFTFPLKCP